MTRFAAAIGLGVALLGGGAARADVAVPVVDVHGGATLISLDGVTIGAGTVGFGVARGGERLSVGGVCAGTLGSTPHGLAIGSVRMNALVTWDPGRFHLGGGLGFEQWFLQRPTHSPSTIDTSFILVARVAFDVARSARTVFYVALDGGFGVTMSIAPDGGGEYGASLVLGFRYGR